MQVKLCFLLCLLTFSLAYDTTVLRVCSGNCTNACGVCSGSTCTKCRQGFTLNSTSKICTKDNCPILGCAVCDSSLTNCLKCLDPSSIFDPAIKSCVQRCPLKNCAKCTATSSFCSQCAQGYALYSLQNQCIDTPIINCKVVYDFRGQQFLCTLCKDGYRPSSDQTQCIFSNCTTITDCQICYNSTVCMSCRIGYSFVNNTCQANKCSVANCLYCDNSGNCLRCKSSFRLDGGQCSSRQCPISFCSTCKPGSMYCETCSSGDVPDMWTKKCPQVSSANLKYLWLLSILVVLIIVVVVVCIYQRRKKDQNNDLPVTTTELKLQGAGTKNTIEVGDNIESSNNLKSHSNIPVKQGFQPI